LSAARLPSRHDLVRLAPAWRDGLVAPPEAALRPHVDSWLDRGLPAVARRLDGGAPPGSVALGVALPPSAGRRRASLVARLDAVAAVSPPLRLAAALPSAPPAWQEALRDLDRAAGAIGTSLGLYGSLAWQHLSGEPYLSERSDVDLLVAPRSGAELRAALGLLAERATLESPRLDGEVLLPGGLGVPWRELLAAPRRILAKSLAHAVLLPLREALGPLAAGEGAP